MVVMVVTTVRARSLVGTVLTIAVIVKAKSLQTINITASPTSSLRPPSLILECSYVLNFRKISLPLRFPIRSFMLSLFELLDSLLHGSQWVICVHPLTFSLHTPGILVAPDVFGDSARNAIQIRHAGIVPRLLFAFAISRSIGEPHALHVVVGS